MCKYLQIPKICCNFVPDFMTVQPTYFEARRTEAALCRDFPVDALFIDGLHAMQLHFQNMGRGYQIPVLKVMNTAHQLIAHMLMHPDRVEQKTYDLMAYKLQNHDMLLMNHGDGDLRVYRAQ